MKHDMDVNVKQCSFTNKEDEVLKGNIDSEVQGKTLIPSLHC